MLIRKEYIDDKDGFLGVWQISETEEELLLLFPEEIRPDMVKAVSSLRSPRRILEWLSTRLLLFFLLDDPKKIQYKENGRPYLADGSYHISISHTKGFAAVLLHKTCEVGVDIEINSNRVNKIAGKFISEEEYIDDKHPVIHRLLHWSAKETLFKLMDKEGVDFRKDLHILPFTPCEKGILQAIVTTDQFLNRVRIHYEVSPDYVLTWTLSSRDVAV
ncbi:MAG TPA: hypothetical protein DDZ96_06795 [Porphyromonadaceae bacterium]|jgi:phosphopantetheinyl transferase|uniref:4'-phosphopantetheinyl transferase superfamily protein n=1 Tax=Limibacterium fermenti TaxID=3229863 RepID=UPI000E81A766|nr:hypothetical protein [Porphyromonadaceae bacterium]HBK30990.1 hypothetical protein [Porphyromonadaceae bacterium]HBL33512.1 hypothetical protein [Porphyromonadaceae bacterium]HBX19598.1 hypothetical protein [Porphyromonadaceae bacterium]HBX46471.1 hypothetical protein [Porphyromonadaceae bacterium]